MFLLVYAAALLVAGAASFGVFDQRATEAYCASGYHLDPCDTPWPTPMWVTCDRAMANEATCLSRVEIGWAVGSLSTAAVGFVATGALSFAGLLTDRWSHRGDA